MQKIIQVKIPPSKINNTAAVQQIIADTVGIDIRNIYGYHIQKQSIDARGRNIFYILQLNVFINEPLLPVQLTEYSFRQVNSHSKKVIIVGAGPAGLFAALKLLESGIQSIIIERGKQVRDRRRDLAVLNKEGIINTESNYCFGEGGAGTYSDGKLYTRSNKRGSVTRILQLLVQHGAEENITYVAHPHIGTNKLPQIITAIRKTIESHGGVFYFNTQLADFEVNKKGDLIKYIITQNGDKLSADAYILATGHSAKDIYRLLHNKKINIESKPFALGVRVEHPQELIDQSQYHCAVRDIYLPPASYSLVQQVNGKGVFSFCMCPGGIIAPAATNPRELVVNGWSPSKRNNPYANSGMVVAVAPEDVPDFSDKGALALMYFQQQVEEKAYAAGGGKFVAPAQRLVDFCQNKLSASLPDCSYLPGIHSVGLNKVLPGFIYTRLQEAFKEFGKKIRSVSSSFYTNEAVVVATESRTSSPVRIPRIKDKFNHPDVENLYPCAEGAGYAGGIVSAAIDGENVAAAIIAKMA